MGPIEVSTEGATPPSLVALDRAGRADPAVVGAKASALARARRAGLPVLDGFVITTTAAGALAGPQPPAELEAELRSAWLRLSAGGVNPVVVRSSSPVEDGRTSSMAGQFKSVLDVRTWDDVRAAVSEVVGSAGDAPMAVLVQPLLQPTWGGVLFGADPVTGRTDRLVVAAVPGGPDRLVSGAVDGVQLSLSPHGRLLDHSAGLPRALRARRARQGLLHLARRVAVLFGGPQDVEWAMDDRGLVTLLQARPITAVGHDVRATGPLLGPGPVAETFPAPLAPLEDDLWIPPLREGLRRALSISGAVSRRRIAASPVVVVVGRRVAADLELLGVAPGRRSLWQKLDPRPPARRLHAAWRVGRLRAGLPALAGDVLAIVDADLARVPALADLDPAARLRLLRRGRDLLVSLHGYEVLAGQLLDVDAGPTAASLALRTLAAERAAGADDDDDLLARHPTLLSLSPPAIGATVALPPVPPVAVRDGDDELGTREALRLRIRWLHELMARTARSLGDDLSVGSGVREWRLAELEAAVERGSLVVPAGDAGSGPPLPAAFRLTPTGVVVPALAEAAGEATGRGAGGGRGSGPVVLEPGSDVTGAVLVVATLDPELAPVLPGLAGLVAETGSVLSHLAILAREYGVPTVVGLAGARQKLTEGSWVVVDGSTGEVSAITDEEWAA